MDQFHGHHRVLAAILFGVDIIVLAVVQEARLGELHFLRVLLDVVFPKLFEV